MYLNRVLKKKNVPLDILVNNKLTSLYWDSIQGDYLEDISTNPPEVNKYLIPEWYSQLKFFTKLGLPRFSKSQLSLSNRTPRAYLKSTFFVGKKKMFFYKNFMDIRRYFFVKKKKTELVKQAKEIGLFLIKRKLARFSRKKHFRGFSRVKHGRFKKFLKKSFLKEKAFIYRYVKRGNRLGATYSNINRRHFFVYRSINRKIKKFKKVNFRYKKKKIRLFGFKTNKKPFSLPKGKAMGTHMFLNLISKSWFLNKKLLLYFFFKKNINLSRQFLILKKKTLGDGKKILNFKKKN